MDTSIFFDIERYSPDRECGTPEENRNQVHLAQFREKVAKRTCQQCVVRPECALYALVSRQPYGIFGGLTPKDRRGILRRRKAHRAA
jgi:WhiB family redox-sensing transcriptional regulator